MSYDLTFVDKPADQSWEDLLETLGEDDEPGERPGERTWNAVLTDARRILGEVTDTSGGSHYELNHEPTGIQLSLYAGEAGITVPYWYKGADAVRVVQAIYALGHIVEQHTGLSGYDAQVELPLAEAAARPGLAAAVFDDVAADFARRGYSSPSSS
ncbi:hypothetical protein Aab01nite_52850 [Paractinoplanes abujensis]|uniref:Uncharacterized protein n=1 Tax=Paractinoplanes abujensis TaxID=882441 RepID=A0A7W7CS30_9ACTN|nr:hypothetical protein [Actinoplanes abujensis]MBB4693647.1 hypothetical protein [Actinoplanes abujensis]GID21695.1 hypothetical protein Aab01nite_52850 [Actinoplanes abujensis]